MKLEVGVPETEQAFHAEMDGDYSLDSVIQWTRTRLHVDAIYTAEEMLEHLRDYHQPGDVFSDEQLAAWAKSNGWVKE